jgi:DNA-directed RNA polymerase specialized sigma54-like protein
MSTGNNNDGDRQLRITPELETAIELLRKSREELVQAVKEELEPSSLALLESLRDVRHR